MHLDMHEWDFHPSKETMHHRLLQKFLETSNTMQTGRCPLLSHFIIIKIKYDRIAYLVTCYAFSFLTYYLDFYNMVHLDLRNDPYSILKHSFQKSFHESWNLSKLLSIFTLLGIHNLC